MTHDLIVIGGGMAGLPFASKAAYKGLNTALVERELLGGTCLNRGCIPTKSMIACAGVAQIVRRAGEYGVQAGTPHVDLSAVVDRKDRIVTGIRDGAYRGASKNERLTLVEGEARLEGTGRVRVGERLLEAPRIVINVGARPGIPPIDGLSDISFLTSREALELRQLPDHLVVIGGGYVGVEFSQMYARFGSRVTVVQRSGRLVPGEEPEISEALAEAFEEEDITIHTSTEAIRAERTDGGIRVSIRRNGDEEWIEGSHLLVAAGRLPNTTDLGLDAAGVETDEQGFIRVDDRFRTTADGVYAMGDVTGEPMFTHSARDDADLLYRIVVKDDAGATPQGRVVPHAVFTDPEIASVGLTESAARGEGFDVSVNIQDFLGVARAKAAGTTRGLIKLVGDRQSGRLLGGHILGPSAGELIHEITLALMLEARAGDLARMIHVHPTLSEGINAAAGGVHRPAG
ncbi:MAG: dihydrolipoyl dehydrogenase [Longimicrobiales bacterium]|nr:dihydrolipoyl dehydrogenase [Longimicrobiales bacterium]